MLLVLVLVKNWVCGHQACHVGDLVDHAGIFFIVRLRSQSMICHVLCSLVGQNFQVTHAVGTQKFLSVVLHE
jgi:hypothetical protein